MPGPSVLASTAPSTNAMLATGTHRPATTATAARRQHAGPRPAYHHRPTPRGLHATAAPCWPRNSSGGTRPGSPRRAQCNLRRRPAAGRRQAGPTEGRSGHTPAGRTSPPRSPTATQQQQVSAVRMPPGRSPMSDEPIAAQTPRAGSHSTGARQRLPGPPPSQIPAVDHSAARRPACVSGGLACPDHARSLRGVCQRAAPEIPCQPAVP